MFALLVAGAVAAQAPDTTQAGQGQTIEAAQAFLRNVMMRGTTQMDTLSDDLRFYVGDVTVEEVYGSGCTTNFIAHTKTRDGPKRIGRRIDWSQVSEVSSPSVTVSGSIKVLDGRIIDTVRFEPESGPMEDRITKAMNFLREHCDATQGGPF